MPPAMAPLTGTTASSSSGGSGESDSSPGNISGQDSASAAPPDDRESSMVPRRDKAAAAAGRARGSAPCLRKGEAESAAAGARTRAAAGADAAHLLPRRPLPAARTLQPTCTREADPAWPRAGGGSGLRCGSLPGGTWKDPGEAARPPAPSEPPSCAPAGVSRGPSEPGLGMERGRAGLGWGRRRQGPPPLTGSRRCRRGRRSGAPNVHSLSLRGGRWPRVLARQSSAPSPGMTRPAP